MAWLKVEAATPDKPELRKITRDCKCSREVAFFCWFKLWRYFDENTDDGFVSHLTELDVDDIAGLPGIAESLKESRWLTFHAGGITIANFDRHNGASAKKRALDARRKQLSRK